jgi:DNA-binding CsgD family transcriptional regulator
MYDVSHRFLHQLAADRRASLHCSGKASAPRRVRRRVGSGIGRPGRGDAASSGSAAGMSAGVLTRREHEVVLLVAEGLTNAEIARELWISPGTVRRHLENVFAKLRVHTRTAAVARIRDADHHP